MIRILRLMEYEYETVEDADNDMSRWQVPAIGSAQHGRIKLRSTTLTDLNSKSSSLQEPLEPLDVADVLWLAALDRVPVDERIEWVADMRRRVEEINRVRANA